MNKGFYCWTLRTEARFFGSSTVLRNIRLRQKEHCIAARPKAHHDCTVTKTPKWKGASARIRVCLFFVPSSSSFMWPNLAFSPFDSRYMLVRHSFAPSIGNKKRHRLRCPRPQLDTSNLRTSATSRYLRLPCTNSRLKIVSDQFRKHRNGHRLCHNKTGLPPPLRLPAAGLRQHMYSSTPACLRSVSRM